VKSTRERRVIRRLIEVDGMFGGRSGRCRDIVAPSTERAARLRPSSTRESAAQMFFSLLRSIPEADNRFINALPFRLIEMWRVLGSFSPHHPSEKVLI
jgi:hypothetical protein